MVCCCLLQQMISGYPAWERLWCVLRQQHLRCWSYPEDVGRKMPLKTINLTKVSQYIVQFKMVGKEPYEFG